ESESARGRDWCGSRRVGVRFSFAPANQCLIVGESWRLRGAKDGDYRPRDPRRAQGLHAPRTRADWGSCRLAAVALKPECVKTGRPKKSAKGQHRWWARAAAGELRYALGLMRDGKDAYAQFNQFGFTVCVSCDTDKPQTFL